MDRSIIHSSLVRYPARECRSPPIFQCETRCFQPKEKILKDDPLSRELVLAFMRKRRRIAMEKGSSLVEIICSFCEVELDDPGQT